jgi:hypothetical protein
MSKVVKPDTSVFLKKEKPPGKETDLVKKLNRNVA